MSIVRSIWRSVLRPWHGIEHLLLRMLGSRATVVGLTFLILMLTVGTVRADKNVYPFKEGLLVIGTAGVIVGIGSMILGITYMHVRWMGFVLLVIGIASSGNALYRGIVESPTFLDWLYTSRGVWGWCLASVFGCRLILFSSSETLQAIDRYSDIRTKDELPEITVSTRGG